MRYEENGFENLIFSSFFKDSAARANFAVFRTIFEPFLNVNSILIDYNEIFLKIEKDRVVSEILGFDQKGA